VPSATLLSSFAATGLTSVVAVAVAVFDLQQLAADFVQADFAGAAVLLTLVVVAAVFDLQQPAADLEQVADFAQAALAGSAVVPTAFAVDLLQVVADFVQVVFSAAALDPVHCAEVIPIATKANITNIINTFFMCGGVF
jgi:hypothetical protein